MNDTVGGYTLDEIKVMFLRPFEYIIAATHFGLVADEAAAAMRAFSFQLERQAYKSDRYERIARSVKPKRRRKHNGRLPKLRR